MQAAFIIIHPENFQFYDFIMQTFLELFTAAELTIPVMLLRIFLSAVAGFILGFERKIHLQNAGLRTHILICLASTLMMLASIYVPHVYAAGRGDPSRIAAQIVSGIGFLGAGAILHQGLNISGLNSAATVWITAGIGIAIGCGMLVAAFICVVLCVFIMFSLEAFEAKYFPAGRQKHLVLIFANDALDFSALRSLIESYGLIIMNVDFSRDMTETRFRLIYTVKAPDNLDIISLTNNLQKIGSIEKIKMTD